MCANYIVVFNEEVTSEEVNKYAAEVEADGGKVNQRYDILNGFSATIHDKTLQSFQDLRGDVIVSIEPDQAVTTQ